jgi:hypothetical protein
MRRCDMAIMMNMSGYEIEREAVALEQYDDEMMYAGWNPQLGLVGNHPAVSVDKHVSLPHELANVDVETFLQQMYKSQR